VVNDYSRWSFEVGYDFDPVTPGYQAPSGNYSHIDIGGYDGDPDRYIFGMADDIDWRDLNPTDGAVVYSSEFDAYNSTYFDDYDRLTYAVANTTSHEMGHLLGLCHHHAFGPIGTADVPGYGEYPFTEGGAETNDHLMATGCTGISLEERVADRYFGERESRVLDVASGMISMHDEADDHSTRETAQALGGGSDLGVTASLDVVGETDWYGFWLEEGDLLSIEVYSERCSRFTDPIDPFFGLYDPYGTLLGSYDDYWSYSTGRDAALLDYQIAETGMWYVVVGGNYTDRTYRDIGGEENGIGDYEVWVHRDPVPEPATCAMLIVGLGGVLVWRRRSR